MQTSPTRTNEDKSKNPLAFCGYDYCVGFSLLELLVAVSILALVSVISAPVIANSLNNLQVKSAAYELVDALKSTRQQALTNSMEAVLLLDVDTHSYVTTDSFSLGIPEDSVITLTTADIELINDSLGNIRFFADGSSTGGEILLAYHNRDYRITVNWLTGHVKLQ